MPWLAAVMAAAPIAQQAMSSQKSGSGGEEKESNPFQPIQKGRLLSYGAPGSSQMGSGINSDNSQLGKLLSDYMKNKQDNPQLEVNQDMTQNAQKLTPEQIQNIQDANRKNIGSIYA